MSKRKCCEEYLGDMIYISRLMEFVSQDGFQWNDGGPEAVVTLDDISKAILEGCKEETEPYGDPFNFPCKERPKSWHIGRILYYIHHPEEIKDIQIDNECDAFAIYPMPVILDGNHRFMAAMWLYRENQIEKIHCLYGGREDVLDYLTGKSEDFPE